MSVCCRWNKIAGPVAEVIIFYDMTRVSKFMNILQSRELKFETNVIATFYFREIF